jgi:uncharacterized OB-fold protein
MKHTIDRIVNKIADYKQCDSCGKINWYENTECIECDSTTFNDIDVGMVKQLKLAFKSNMNLEIEV